MLATNTIAQGDSREVGLDQIEGSGCSVYRAISTMKWPGDAHLEVAAVWVSKARWSGSFVLDDSAVEGISTRLAPPEMVAGEPYELLESRDKAFIGSYILGMGFTLPPDEAATLIEGDVRNKEVLFPYLNGENFNSRPDQSPSRWVINFFDWPLDRARTYQDCFRIILTRVKPERDGIVGRNPESTRRGTNWWKYAQDANNLYSTIKRLGLSRVLVRSRVSNINSIAFSDSSIVFSDATVVFAFEDYGHFAVLQSMAHTVWLEQYSSSMRNDVRYTPSRCFGTFCFPRAIATLSSPGKAYYEHRSSAMASRREGLTKVYNRCFNPHDSERDIQELRDLHIEMDKAVAAAYGWSDLDLEHGFHETKQGIRFTISEAARREVLARLLKLNHERYAEEVAQGLHDKKGGGGRVKGGGKKTGTRAKKGKGSSEPSLFGEEE
jgi:hypothetical protein